MEKPFSRRDLFRKAPGIGLAASAITGASASSALAASFSEPVSSVWAGFPRQDAKQVREIVGASHRNEAKVRELIEAKPALVNAWWDWGYGDWESPLGAASHVGNRAIAAFLIEHGARIDIFAATMLGMTEVVKAFVKAQPGVQRTLGPHGITLLAHAKAGGVPAAETLAFLESLGDANISPTTAPLPDREKLRYVGTYSVEGAPDVRLEVTLSQRGQLTILRKDEGSCNIHYVGKDEFFPAGVPSTRIRFTLREGKAHSLTIIERVPVLTAIHVNS
jgi:hypothetical protein